MSRPPLRQLTPAELQFLVLEGFESRDRHELRNLEDIECEELELPLMAVRLQYLALISSTERAFLEGRYDNVYDLADSAIKIASKIAFSIVEIGSLYLRAAIQNDDNRKIKHLMDERYGDVNKFLDHLKLLVHQDASNDAKTLAAKLCTEIFRTCQSKSHKPMVRELICRILPVVVPLLHAQMIDSNTFLGIIKIASQHRASLIEQRFFLEEFQADLLRGATKESEENPVLFRVIDGIDAHLNFLKHAEQPLLYVDDDARGMTLHNNIPHTKFTIQAGGSTFSLCVPNTILCAMLASHSMREWINALLRGETVECNLKQVRRLFQHYGNRVGQRNDSPEMISLTI